jgi:uncharacterized protein YdhG (YjbR/CyaY superfamily)
MATRRQAPKARKAAASAKEERAPRAPAKPGTIDDYLASLDAGARPALEALRRTIKAIVPEAEECISYGVPAFRLNGVVVAGFAATKKGFSYFPFSGSTLATLAAELTAYGKTKSALHVAPNEALPERLVRRLLEARIAETRP